MKKPKQVKVIGPDETREKNIITKRELQALVKMARERLRIGLDYDVSPISRENRRLATSAVYKLERMIAEAEHRWVNRSQSPA